MIEIFIFGLYIYLMKRFNESIKTLYNSYIATHLQNSQDSMRLIHKMFTWEHQKGVHHVFSDASVQLNLLIQFVELSIL